MSVDLTIWHAPRLRSFDAAMARLARDAPLRPRARARLDALVTALRAGPLPDAALSIEPVIDERTGTLGLSLVGSVAAGSRDALLAVLRAHGMACYDPQDGVVIYADGRTSQEESCVAGVHEGVGICLAELRAQPPLPTAALRDSLDALLQFALADSPDPSAAAALAFPVLLDLVEGAADADSRVAARLAAVDLCGGLRDRDAPLPLDPAERARALGLGDRWLAEAVEATRPA